MILSELKEKEKFYIKKILLQGELGKRIAEMGFCASTKGEVVRKVPLGGPIQIKILGYDISLRKEEAEGIEVEKDENEINRKRYRRRNRKGWQ